MIVIMWDYCSHPQDLVQPRKRYCETAQRRLHSCRLMEESTRTASWCVVTRRKRAAVVSASQTWTRSAASEYPRLNLFLIGESLTTAATAQRGGCRFSSCWSRILPI